MSKNPGTNSLIIVFSEYRPYRQPAYSTYADPHSSTPVSASGNGKAHERTLAPKPLWTTAVPDARRVHIFTLLETFLEIRTTKFKKRNDYTNFPVTNCERNAKKQRISVVPFTTDFSKTATVRRPFARHAQKNSALLLRDGGLCCGTSRNCKNRHAIRHGVPV